MPPTLQQATADPCLCRRLLDTHSLNVSLSLKWVSTWLQGTLIDRSASNASIPALKPSTTQGPKVSGQDIPSKFSSNKEHSPELQDTGSPKSPQNHRHPITHYWTFHRTPERRNTAPPTRTPTQASLTKKPWHSPLDCFEAMLYRAWLP